MVLRLATWEVDMLLIGLIYNWILFNWVWSTLVQSNLFWAALVEE